MTRILVTIGNHQQAEQTIKRISTILGRSERIPEPTYILNQRIMKSKADRYRTTFDYFDLGGINSRLSRDMLGMRSHTGQIRKRVVVKVVVDESGNVTSAIAETKLKKLKKEAESEIRKWKIKPVEYKGVKWKLYGVIHYTGAIGPRVVSN